MRATLKKREILRRKKDIDALFSEGKSVKALPLKVLYQVVPLSEAAQSPPVMAMFVVSRRNLKKAAHRNRVKRLMREAYRLLKGNLAEAFARKVQDGAARQLRLGLLYQSSSKDASLTQLQKALSEAMEKIIARL